MSRLYLLDTNTVSYILRQNSAAVMARLRVVPMHELAISAITEAELRYGIALNPEMRLAEAVEKFLMRVAIVPWGSAAARSYAELRSRLERLGRPLANIDLVIAAHAIALNAVLVSSDRAFQRISQLELEDWTKP